MAGVFWIIKCYPSVVCSKAQGQAFCNWFLSFFGLSIHTQANASALQQAVYMTVGAQGGGGTPLGSNRPRSH